MSYQVESSVPIPARRGLCSKYPFASLAVGESFTIPLEVRGVAAVCAAAAYFTSRNTGVVFSRRQDKVANVMRFWRLS
jgi:hypothetical protein